MQNNYKSFHFLHNFFVGNPENYWNDIPYKTRTLFIIRQLVTVRRRDVVLLPRCLDQFLAASRELIIQPLYVGNLAPNSNVGIDELNENNETYKIAICYPHSPLVSIFVIPIWK